MKKIILAILIVILGAGLVWFSFYLARQKNTNNQNTNNTSPNPITEEPIKITSPQANEALISPITITGQAKGTWFFEASFPIKITDSQGAILGTSHAEAQSDWMTEDWVPFTATVEFNATTSTDGFIIFQKDNPSGLPANDASFKLPIKFTPVETTTVKVFFSNNQFDPEMLDCEKVYAIDRLVVKTEGIGTAAINQLLKGPNEAEISQGYFTSINSGVTLQSLKIENSTAYADFNSTLNNVAGSCRVTNIRSQIAQTLQQFPTITSVIISVDGESEAILQP